MQIVTELVQTNIAWLGQALSLIRAMDDEVFATTPRGMAPHRVGSHLRHVLEFYECFLDGLESQRVNYDSRKHDLAVETQRAAASARIEYIIGRLYAVRDDAPLAIRVEDAQEDAWLTSSIGRELQALSSHTIHHFALIAITLRLHGVEVHPDFGMSPSTLRHNAAVAPANSNKAA